MSDIDAVLKIDKSLRPNLYARTEAIARIIDPAAFMADWVCEPASAAKLLRLRLAVQRGNAMAKAHEVLKYLGVNSEPDWFDILDQLAKERP